MNFRVTGLDSELFSDLHLLSDGELQERGCARIRIVDKHSAPCRISLDDAEVGECVVLLNYDHQPADTPYRQQGPIFVRDMQRRFDAANIIPPALARRTLSLRGYDAAHMMVEADLVEGADAAGLIARFFANAEVAYIHAHYARRGCFAARIDCA